MRALVALVLLAAALALNLASLGVLVFRWREVWGWWMGPWGAMQWAIGLGCMATATTWLANWVHK